MRSRMASLPLSSTAPAGHRSPRRRDALSFSQPGPGALCPPHRLPRLPPGGLSYLAQRYLGKGFGGLYDPFSIVILWLAGAGSMASLLGVVPRYLPRFGLAPEWARQQRSRLTKEGRKAA